MHRNNSGDWTNSSWDSSDNGPYNDEYVRYLIPAKWLQITRQGTFFYSLEFREWNMLDQAKKYKHQYVRRCTRGVRFVVA